jgi:hypothetical protein
MGHAGQERAKAEFSWERMVTRYENLYQSLLEQQTGSAPWE